MVPQLQMDSLACEHVQGLTIQSLKLINILDYLAGLIFAKMIVE